VAEGQGPQPGPVLESPRPQNSWAGLEMASREGVTPPSHAVMAATLHQVHGPWGEGRNFDLGSKNSPCQQLCLVWYESAWGWLGARGPGKAQSPFLQDSHWRVVPKDSRTKTPGQGQGQWCEDTLHQHLCRHVLWICVYVMSWYDTCAIRILV
jgi:hypothetical protein